MAVWAVWDMWLYMAVLELMAFFIKLYVVLMGFFVLW
jgi:hypothetical protein